MASNFIVNTLPDYVQQNQDLLVKNFALVGGSTRRRMTIQTGVKYKGTINFLDVVPELQSGTDCAFTPLGSASLTQRELECPSIKVNMELCPRTLIGKYAEYLVRVNATEESLPFEQYVTDAITGEIVKKIEKLIWQGDKTKTGDSDLKWFNGILKIASTDSDVVDVTIGGTSAYADIKAVYMAMTEETLDRGGEIYVSPSVYRSFLQELVTLNLYHYAGAVEDYPGEFILPGTDVKVVRTPGLKGVTSIIGTFPANLVYGCDMENDAEAIDLWYSKDDRVFKVEVLWNSGVQIAFPDQVVLGKTA